MAFCTNCGSSMDANAFVCTKCGKTVTAEGTTPSASPSTAQPTYTAAPQAAGGSNMGKVLLTIGAVLVLIFAVCIGGLLFVAHRMKHHVYITENGKDRVVETPFGRATVSTEDAQTVAHRIGIDLYPGAEANESKTAQVGNMTTATIKLTTSDPVDKVAGFYRSHFPNATISEEGSSKFTLVSNDNDGTLTISAKSAGNGTNIAIAKVTGMKIKIQAQ